MSLTLRRATPADTQAIAALLAASYDDNPKADPEVLRWQYWENPFGPARSWVAEVGGEVVGHWAAVPVPLRLSGGVVSAAKGVDIATHPAHRRRGVFGQVARALVQDCRPEAPDGGVDILLTHPNPESAPAVERAGAVLIGNASAYVWPTSTSFVARRMRVPVPLAGLARRLAFGDRGEADEAGAGAEVPRDLEALWQEVSAVHPTGIVRDPAWWRWRYEQRPRGRYRYVTARRGGTLTGAAIYTVQGRYGGRFALVCEALAASGAAARGLVRAMAARARAEGADGLAAVALPSSHQARLLAAAGLRRLPRRLEPRPLRVMVAVPGGDATTPARLPWSMAWGDLDHV